MRSRGANFDLDFKPVFGVDDGDNRHVSTWLVDTTVDPFLKTYWRETPQE